MTSFMVQERGAAACVYIYILNVLKLFSSVFLYILKITNKEVHEIIDFK